jgi:hypothetical protein
MDFSSNTVASVGSKGLCYFVSAFIFTTANATFATVAILFTVEASNTDNLLLILIAAVFLALEERLNRTVELLEEISATLRVIRNRQTRTYIG